MLESSHSSTSRVVDCHRVDKFQYILSTEMYITPLSLTANYIIINADIWMAYWCAATNYDCASLCPPWYVHVHCAMRRPLKLGAH